MSNYWNRFTSSRISRRKAMALTGSAAAATAFIAACGGDDDSSSGNGGASGPTGGTGGSSGLVYTPVDTTSAAKPGGALKHWAGADITHFDALASNSASTVNFGSVFAYNLLLRFKAGVYPEVADGTTEPALAESFEVSPDRLTITMKIRQGAGTKWDERPPTNGREMDMDDVLFSWGKYVELNPGAANVASARNPSAPIESLTASDDTTLVVKLTKPDATVISLLADTAGSAYIMPKESADAFDPATTVRGNGPWQLEEHVPSVRFTWKKNPNFYKNGRPFPDFLERPIITELAQRLAQFRAGNIHSDIVANVQEEVIQLKRDVPEANLRLPNSYSPTLSPSVWFGYEGDSPFKDQRVRQAFSLMEDRESYNVAMNNAEAFEAEGLGVEPRYNTCVTAGWGPYWLDPLGSDFGENAKYLQYNPEEAKALLSAAGFPDGFPTEGYFNSEGQYGADYARAVEIHAGFFTNGGVNVNQNPLQYSEYLNEYYFGYRSGASTQGGSGEKSGYAGYTVQAERPYPSAVSLMLGSWHSNGGAFHGLSPDGNDAFSGDPELNRMIETIQGEFDQDTQIELTHELIRYMTGQTYMIPNPVVVPEYQVWWPAVSNLGMRERWASNNAFWAEEAIDFWLDTSKAPFV